MFRTLAKPALSAGLRVGVAPMREFCPTALSVRCFSDTADTPPKLSAAMFRRPVAGDSASEGGVADSVRKFAEKTAAEEKASGTETSDSSHTAAADKATTSADGLHAEGPLDKPAASAETAAARDEGRPIGLIVVGLALMGCSGYSVGYCIKHRLSFSEFRTLASKEFEGFNERGWEWWSDFLDKKFPRSEEYLLPDFNDLQYPEHLPTLVVDLDKVVAKMEHDHVNGWRVVKRPGADRFFRELMFSYELVLWSEDNFPVAQDVCMKWGIPVVGALHRDQCTRRRGSWVKDLSRLGRRVDRTVLLDHDPIAGMYHPDNTVLIREFDGDQEDRELENLIDFLKMVAATPGDVRDTIQRHGGGDVDLGRRWVVQQAEVEKKAASRRSLFGRFIGKTGQPDSTAQRKLF